MSQPTIPTATIVDGKIILVGPGCLGRGHGGQVPGSNPTIERALWSEIRRCYDVRNQYLAMTDSYWSFQSAVLISEFIEEARRALQSGFASDLLRSLEQLRAITSPLPLPEPAPTILPPEAAEILLAAHNRRIADGDVGFDGLPPFARVPTFAYPLPEHMPDPAPPAANLDEYAGLRQCAPLPDPEPRSGIVSADAMKASHAVHFRGGFAAKDFWQVFPRPEPEPVPPAEPEPVPQPEPAPEGSWRTRPPLL